MHMYIRLSDIAKALFALMMLFATLGIIVEMGAQSRDELMVGFAIGICCSLSLTPLGFWIDHLKKRERLVDFP